MSPLPRSFLYSHSPTPTDSPPFASVTLVSACSVLSGQLQCFLLLSRACTIVCYVVLPLVPVTGRIEVQCTNVNAREAARPHKERQCNSLWTADSLHSSASLTAEQMHSPWHSPWQDTSRPNEAIDCLKSVRANLYLAGIFFRS